MPIHMLIKPASGACNMRCTYCFYCDETNKRETKNYGMMSLETLENLVKKPLQAGFSPCVFAFQGGEPTLCGLDFYKHFVALVAQYKPKDTEVQFAIQTNGYAIDNEWATFFAENNFLVGLSLDGNKRVHDSLRFDAFDKGTFNKVMHASQLFDNHKVEYNILTVVTANVAKNIKEIYEFYGRNNFIYQQYIPCLDPIGEDRGTYEWSLTPQLYTQFLTQLFDLWYRSFKRNKPISMRYFDNLVMLLMGYPPESCGMLGHCTFQNVIEADGSMYPCDFYVLDDYKIGNINTDSFDDINNIRSNIGFIQKSQYVDEDCKECQWAALCRGGCRRDRDTFTDAPLEKNYFCPAFKQFFEYAVPRLQEVARTISSRSKPQ